MKKIIFILLLAASAMTAQAQSSVTINVINGSGPGCCPIVTHLELYVVNHCSGGTWLDVTSMVPACGTPTVTITAASLGYTDIIAAQGTVNGVSVQVGNTTVGCPTPYPQGTSGTVPCQWGINWNFWGTSPAVLNIG